MDQTNAMKRGYLHDNFRYFHLKDSNKENFNYHYHEFSKIVILISGEVSYLIEGKLYQLLPWDILFVNHHDVHKPIVHSKKPYERIVIWINPNYLTTGALHPYHLNQCFDLLQTRQSNLLRIQPKKRINLVSLLNELEASLMSLEFAHELFTNTLFLQWMVMLNRLCLAETTVDTSESVQTNKVIDALIAYINQNIAGDLKLETIANELYLSPSYLMHQFKDATGSTLHTYITRKRLSNALQLLRDGTAVTVAASMSGYSDYSTFLRTFRKYYHCTPTEYLNGKVTMFPSSGKALIE